MLRKSPPIILTSGLSLCFRSSIFWTSSFCSPDARPLKSVTLWFDSSWLIPSFLYFFCICWTILSTFSMSTVSIACSCFPSFCGAFLKSSNGGIQLYTFSLLFPFHQEGFHCNACFVYRSEEHTSEL